MSQPNAAGPIREVPLASVGAASDYAVDLLATLGWPARRDPRGATDPSPGIAWAESGAMALTGPADGPPLPIGALPAAVASCADGAAKAFAALAAHRLGEAPRDLDGPALLGERAALAEPGLTRAGRTAPGGSAHLLACADGWLALNLARPEDEALLPAWLEATPAAQADPVAFVAATIRGRPAGPLVARGRMMGLALAELPEPTSVEGPRPWVSWDVESPARPIETAPLVVDLSSLWAGPLCGQLLAECGARVVKVESLERPDGARRGSARFFDLMNAGKQSVALPFTEDCGRDALAGLLRRADIVIESSRPRALRQLGIDAEAIVRDHGVTWVSITGHGRHAPAADWIAFGDDAAVAAGLVARMPDGCPVFCGDAIADPLTGVHAALAALASWGSGVGRLLDVSLVGVASHVRSVGVAAADPSAPEPSPPRAREVRGPCPALGRDTADVLGALGLAC